MIYEDALSYIRSLLKFGVRPGLSRMDALLKRLGDPQSFLKYVHVAGTNGKGSVSTAVSNVLTESGYNVGLYTSPYVTEFLERIQYNGKPVEKSVFCDAVERVKKETEELNKNGVELTEFEAITAAAFLCFKKLGCDVVVLEVGLGGRLDATNVIRKAEVDIITSLSLDHTAVLGDTLDKIAYEKCGILRDNGTLVLSAKQEKTSLCTVQKICKEKNCRLIIPDVSCVNVISSSIFGTVFEYKNTKYNIPMPGFHQVINMISVIEAVEVLKEKGYNITKEGVVRGVGKTRLPARTEILSREPLVILDGGHNEDGARAFYNTVKDELKHRERLFVVAGMMRDKAVEKSLAPLLGEAFSFTAVTPENPRAMSCFELAQIAKKYCNNVSSAENTCDAVKTVYNQLEKNDILCVVGSLYLAGEVRETLINTVKGEY